jgi:hypothetical protein
MPAADVIFFLDFQQNHADDSRKACMVDASIFSSYARMLACCGSMSCFNTDCVESKTSLLPLITSSTSSAIIGRPTLLITMPDGQVCGSKQHMHVQLPEFHSKVIKVALIRPHLSLEISTHSVYLQAYGESAALR